MALPGTWRNDNAQVFVGSFRQPYEALAANDLSPMGGTQQQLLPTLTGPANFSTRYYDTGVDPRSFPQLGAQAAMQPAQQALQQPAPQQAALGAQKGGYESAEGSGASWSSTTARTVERQAKKKRRGPQGPPLSDYVRYFRDHMSRFFLWWGALFVMIFAVITAFVAMEAVLSEEFQTFSHLAWVSWFPSFSAMMLVLFVLSACALAAGVLALWVGYKESRPALRAFFVASATLGVLMLCMALFTWLYTARARPFVVSAANLLCQDLHPFQCADVSTSLPPREPSAASTAPPPQAPPTTIPPLPEPLPSGPSVATTRRLGSSSAGATAAVAAASFLGEVHASTGSRAPALSPRGPRPGGRLFCPRIMGSLRSVTVADEDAYGGRLLATQSSPPMPPRALVLMADWGNVLAGLSLSLSFLLLSLLNSAQVLKPTVAVMDAIEATMCAEGVFYAVAGVAMVAISAITGNRRGVVSQAVIALGGVFFAFSGFGNPAEVTELKQVVVYPEGFTGLTFFEHVCPWYGITCFMLGTAMGLSGVRALPKGRLVSPFWGVFFFFAGAWTIGLLHLWGPLVINYMPAGKLWFAFCGAVFLTVGAFIFFLMDKSYRCCPPPPAHC